MTQEMLEILIGKYLDGEITPSEQHILETALEEDSQARKLFEQMQDLHKSSRQTVASEVFERAGALEEIFEQAWRRQTNCSVRRRIRVGDYLRFATGLAAGFAIGLSLHFMLLGDSTTPSDQAPPTAVARMEPQEPALQTLSSDETPELIRTVDWYNFTDEAGDQWLIEGLRENVVRPVVYDGDL